MATATRLLLILAALAIFTSTIFAQTAQVQKEATGPAALSGGHTIEQQIPAQCQKIAEEIKALRAAQASLLEELKTAPPQVKPGLIALSRFFSTLIAKKQKQLDACIKQTVPPVPCDHP